MKKPKLVLLLAAVCLAALTGSTAPLGTTFTYQGRLTDGGNPANGNYAMVFYLYDAPTNGNQLGQLGVVSVPVGNGLFTQQLDFGAAFDGNARWLELSVQTNGAAGFTTLTPRQPLTPAPYALFAGAANSAVSAANAATANSATTVAAGGVNSTAIQDGAVNTAKIADGTVTAADVNAPTFNATFWKTDGNTGTAPGMHFLGTTDSQPFELKVANDRVFRFEPALEVPNVIGGSRSNSVTAGIRGATIAGGGLPLYPHTVSADYGAIGGGTFHIVGGPWGTIAGGRDHRVYADHSTVGGGRGNDIRTNASYATISGGRLNWINTNALDATIGGGNANVIDSDAYEATIGGGFNSVIHSNASYSTIAGGQNNAIQPLAFSSSIGGGVQNTIHTNGYYATIAGGLANRIGINTRAGTVGGGENNHAIANHATVSGGLFNTNSGPGATIGGGNGNVALANDTVIGGGIFNRIDSNSLSSVISGGRNNFIEPNSAYAHVGGGLDNRIGTDADYTVIGGGLTNTVGAVSRFSAIAGGARNTVGTNSLYAAIGGGTGNSISNGTFYSAIPGGFSNSVSGSYGFASGTFARANHTGSFVWADWEFADFPSTAVNQFSVRARGGARFETGGAGVTVDGQPVLAGAVTAAQIGDGATLAEISDDDGTGSGLDADRVDGLDSTAFALSAHDHYSQSWTGAAFRGFTVTTSQTGGGVAAIRGATGSGTGFTLGGPVGIWGDSESGSGVLGFTASTAGGSGIFGSAVATNGSTRGVTGENRSTAGSGVYGHASATNGFTRGVIGEADSPDGVGVFGYHDAATGTGAGVEGVTDSTGPAAVALLGRVTSTAPGANSAAVRGINSGTASLGIGVWGSQNGTGWGVYGQSVSGVGVRARSTSGNPIEAYGNNDADREFYVSNTGSVFADGPYSGAGADFAEMLPAHDGLEPGDVLVIGDDGQLARSSHPHQESVVGVHSTKPGFLGGAGDDADLTGKVPLAVIGVVPVKVTNENGAIKPGNLLTSSSTAGHAMKAGANAPNGTVIGKSLGAFNGESGTIQMLVLLQ